MILQAFLAHNFTSHIQFLLDVADLEDSTLPIYDNNDKMVRLCQGIRRENTGAILYMNKAADTRPARLGSIRRQPHQ